MAHGAALGEPGDGALGGAARNAQDEGVGQGIAQERLEYHPRAGQRGPHERREHDAGQANPSNDIHHRITRARSKERLPGFPGRHRTRTHRQGEYPRRQQADAEQGQGQGETGRGQVLHRELSAGLAG